MTRGPSGKGGGMGGQMPFESAVARFRDEAEHLFDRFFREAWGTSPLESVPARFGWGPRIDLAETDGAVIIHAELPGVDPADVQIDVTGDTLTIRGEKKRETGEQPASFYCMERQHGAFQRNVQLPGTVDADKVDATFKNGVLTIEIAKRADAKPRRINIRAGE